MNTFAKSALVLGTVGALALGSMTASEARSGRWVAGAAIGAGLALGAAAANSAYYNNGYYNNGYAPDYAYAPGYNAYGYAPGYSYEPAPAYGYGYYGSPDLSTQSAPRHRDARGGYNSNTLAPWQDRRLQGID